jgi:hypothetical protein
MPGVDEHKAAQRGRGLAEQGLRQGREAEGHERLVHQPEDRIEE